MNDMRNVFVVSSVDKKTSEPDKAEGTDLFNLIILKKKTHSCSILTALRGDKQSKDSRCVARCVLNIIQVDLNNV